MTTDSSLAKTEAHALGQAWKKHMQLFAAHRSMKAGVVDKPVKFGSSEFYGQMPGKGPHGPTAHGHAPENKSSTLGWDTAVSDACMSISGF